MKKKKILFQSDFSLAKTGFGRNAKSVLSHLFKTGKYDIVHYCCGLNWSNPELNRTPWKSIGSLPDNKQELEELNRDPEIARMANYGAHYIDRIIQQEKPDIYIAVQDIWGVDFAIQKKWWSKISTVIWTTLDSLPILPSAIEKADKIKNYWIWSSFATDALHELGHTHVKTVHGIVEDECFRNLENSQKLELRQRFGLPPDSFIVGFVFRNQLRKSVPNLIEGYKLFKEKNPAAKSFLLLHTHFSEGWNVHRLADEYGINKMEILTTHICKNCWQYEIKPFFGQQQNCRFCGAEKSQETTNVGAGVDEKQLNEVYNLMDVYCHPFTSGGQEIPIQEAKLTELITLVTNYSCGEEMCAPEANSLELNWSEYREHGTEFRKASTSPHSICKQLSKVFKMSPDKRREMGKKARGWAIKNFSPSYVGKEIENFLDSCPFTDYDFSVEEEKKDPHAEINSIEDNSQWVKELYAKILKRPEVDEKDDGHQYWMGELKKGANRHDIENYFRQVAIKENTENTKVEFSKVLDENDKGKRILYVMPETEKDVFLSSSLFESLKETYPDYNLYVATKPEYFEILDGNEHVHKVIPYLPQMDNLLWLEGQGEHEGFFDMAFLAHANTQRFVNYTHNSKDEMVFNLEK
jgi:glycosyltransferase involved in cell wall biosynthesis